MIPAPVPLMAVGVIHTVLGFRNRSLPSVVCDTAGDAVMPVYQQSQMLSMVM